MSNLWGNTNSGRKRFAIISYVVIGLICLSILVGALYFNFKPSKNKPIELTQTEKQFNDLFLRVQKLENLSKQYNENDYQLRVLIYLRSCKYKDEQWNLLAGGEVDRTFITYVDENEGPLNDVSSFRPLNEWTAEETLNEIEFVVPSTNEKVDFYHLFATLNMNYMNNQNSSDLAGWAGDLVQLMKEFKSSNKIGNALLLDIKNAFNHESSFGSADVCADADAINIFDYLKNTNGGTIYSSINSYYKNLTNKHRIQSFREKTFTSSNIEELLNEIKTRITGEYIEIPGVGGIYSNLVHQLAYTYGVDYATHSNVVNACIQVFAEYLFEI